METSMFSYILYTFVSKKVYGVCLHKITSYCELDARIIGYNGHRIGTAIPRLSRCNTQYYIYYLFHFP